LKVLVAGAALDPNWKGGEPLIAKLVVESLRKWGLEVVTYSKVRTWKEKLDALYLYDINPLLYSFYLKYLRLHKPNIVLGFYDYDCSLCLASWKLKIPYVACVHIYWPICPILTSYIEGKGVCFSPSFLSCLKHLNSSSTKFPNPFRVTINILRYGKFLSRFSILSKSNSIIVPSHFVKKKLDLHGFQNVHVIHNGINLHDFSNCVPRWSDSKKLILNPTGYTDERKGFKHFLTMSKELKKRLNSKTEFLATNYGGDKYVRGCGYLTRSQYIKLLKEAYLIVIPPLWDEPFGLTVVEAMAAGKPVVAYRSGAIPEIVVDGITGFLVQKANIKSLSSAVEYLIEDEELAKRMGIEGRKRVEKYFSSEVMAKTYLALLRSIVDYADY